MIVWFLFAALLLADGRPAAPIPTSYASEQECDEAGLALSAQVVANPQVKHGVWLCYSIMFETDDPILPKRSATNG